MRAIFKNPTKGKLAINDIAGNFITRLAPGESFDLTPYIGEVYSFEEIMQKVVVNNHIQSIIHNSGRGKQFKNISQSDYFVLQTVVTTDGLEIEFSDISRSPVTPATDLAGWNSFFDTENYADAPFNAVEVDGNTVKLKGATNLALYSEIFRDDGGITSVNDKSSSTIELESMAFRETMIENASFPNVTIVGNFALYYCESLVEISLPKAETIGTAALSKCGYTDISLPLATTIGTQAFAQCLSLSGVSLPNAVTMSYSVFACCTSLKNILLPSLETMAQGLFSNCSILESVSMPKLKVLSFQTFSNVSSLIGVNFPEVTEVQYEACYGCTSLTGISLPHTTTIGNNAFYLCTSLSEISIPVAETISDSAFSLIQNKEITLTLSQTLLESNNTAISTLTGNNTVTIIAV